MVFDAGLLAVADNGERLRCHTADADWPKPHDQWIAFLGGVLGSTALLRDDLCLYRQHGANEIGARAEHGAALVKASMTTGSVRYRRMSELATEYGSWCRTLSKHHGGLAAERLASRAERFAQAAEVGSS